MKVDLAVLNLLQLDADTTSVSSAGGGGCSSASTSKIVSRLSDGTEKTFFMKTGSGSAAEIMFEGQQPNSYDGPKTTADGPMKANMHRSTPLMLSFRHCVRIPMVMESLNQIHRPLSW